jgi:hypothetical protein
MRGQWIPSPPPISSHFFRSRTEARRSRGKHSSGTDSSRPSANFTIILASVKATPDAKGRNLLAKMGMPSLQEETSFFAHYSTQLRDLVSPKTHVLCQPNWLQPELRISLCLLHVGMRRFLTFVAEKEEAVAVFSQNRRHPLATYRRPAPTGTRAAWPSVGVGAGICTVLSPDVVMPSFLRTSSSILR